MADYIIPISPVATGLDFQNLDDHYTLVVGTSAGLISTDDGQILARAMHTAYWEIFR